MDGFTQPIYGNQTRFNQGQTRINQGFNQGFSQPIVQDDRIWVQNEASAENFLLSPNGFVRLWSATENKFYEKRADATGRPLQMETYEYKRISPQIATSKDEVGKISMDDINARFEEITNRIDALEKVKKGVVKNAKSDTDDSSV